MAMIGMSADDLAVLWDKVKDGDDEQSVLTRRLWAEYVAITSQDIGEALLADLRRFKFVLVPGAVVEHLELAAAARGPSDT